MSHFLGEDLITNKMTAAEQNDMAMRLLLKKNMKYDPEFLRQKLEKMKDETSYYRAKMVTINRRVLENHYLKTHKSNMK